MRCGSGVARIPKMGIGTNSKWFKLYGMASSEIRGCGLFLLPKAKETKPEKPRNQFTSHNSSLPVVISEPPI